MKVFILVQLAFSSPCQFPFNCLPTHFQFPANSLPNRCQKSDTNKDRMPDRCLSAQSGVSPARWRRPLRSPLRASPRDPVMLAQSPSRLDRTARENALLQRQASAPRAARDRSGRRKRKGAMPQPGAAGACHGKKGRAPPARQASCGMKRPLQGSGLAFSP